MTAVVMQQQLLLASRPDMWTTGLFDVCDDMNICCCGFWCYHCLVGRTLSEFGENHCVACCDFGAPSAVILALRYGVRKQHGIQGTLCNDLCTVAFCGLCAACQVAREIKIRKTQQLVATTVINVQPAALPLQSAAYPGHPGPVLMQNTAYPGQPM
ncbi:cornifelin homolog [Engraulis encrasicolus]|uniref:cornifelin homolog n=1 Tax=Engraulis encrasicolus TaxID=184585 RepID=UPI002FD4D6FF